VTIVRNPPVVYTIAVADPASKPVAGAWILLRTVGTVLGLRGR